MFAQCAVRHTSFKKRTFVGSQKCVFCCLKRDKRSKIKVKANKRLIFFYDYFIILRMINTGRLLFLIKKTTLLFLLYVIQMEDVQVYLRKKRSTRRKEIPVGIFNAKPTKQTVVINNNRPMDTVDIGECFVTIADECRDAFRAHVERRLRCFPDALTADKAAKIIGYAPAHGALVYSSEAHLRSTDQRQIYPPKSALVDFLVDDFAFEIVHKSTWHLNTILLFVEKE